MGFRDADSNELGEEGVEPDAYGVLNIANGRVCLDHARDQLDDAPSDRLVDPEGSVGRNARQPRLGAIDDKGKVPSPGADLY